jgi:hypothetical protein
LNPYDLFLLFSWDRNLGMRSFCFKIKRRLIEPVRLEFLSRDIGLPKKETTCLALGVLKCPKDSLQWTGKLRKFTSD